MSVPWEAANSNVCDRVGVCVCVCVWGREPLISDSLSGHDHLSLLFMFSVVVKVGVNKGKDKQ